MHYTCPCSGQYRRIPDEETSGNPPSWLARQFHCDNCGADDWLEPFDLNLEEWPEEDRVTV